jgi:hypothetical protein
MRGLVSYRLHLARVWRGSGAGGRGAREAVREFVQQIVSNRAWRMSGSPRQRAGGMPRPGAVG